MGRRWFVPFPFRSESTKRRLSVPSLLRVRIFLSPLSSFCRLYSCLSSSYVCSAVCCESAGRSVGCVSYATAVAPADNGTADPSLPSWLGKAPVTKRAPQVQGYQTGTRRSCSSASWDQTAFPARATRLRDCFTLRRVALLGSSAVRAPFTIPCVFSVPLASGRFYLLSSTLWL